jgi:hypothetical protein
MENKDIMVILNCHFYKIKTEKNDFLFPKHFVSLNKDGGVVKIKKIGGEIKMFGCKSFMHIWRTGLIL